jgi:ATP-dependent Clp protease ATP-binding subunit ClpA
MGLANPQRPKGSFLFVGPTGVGKTELTNVFTDYLFEGAAPVRFDMSEYQLQKSVDKLIGENAQDSGLLGRALRSVTSGTLLFDEIEKAHPRILDKFLQILEDGRLTDGRGGTVHFSEAIIVFTSNLGIYKVDETGRRVQNVAPGTPYEELEVRVREEIVNHFTLTLNRPELLNRIGDNVIVFDYISPEIGARLVDLYLQNVAHRVQKELGVPLTYSDSVRSKLTEIAVADLSLGGRGIGATLESSFVNPLARALFARNDDSLAANAVFVERDPDGIWEVELG